MTPDLRSDREKACLAAVGSGNCAAIYAVSLRDKPSNYGRGGRHRKEERLPELGVVCVLRRRKSSATLCARYMYGVVLRNTLHAGRSKLTAHVSPVVLAALPAVTGRTTAEAAASTQTVPVAVDAVACWKRL